jgi:hypothetical protein
MHPVNIFADNIAVLFPRDKKYNQVVKWTDLTIYFRYHGKLIKRCPTIITKDRVIEDYKELLELFDRQEWDEQEKKDEVSWSFGGFKNLTAFKRNKNPILRFLYDDPENPEIHQDHYLLASKNEFGYKPYMVEVVVSDKDLTQSVLKRAAAIYLSECFNVKVSPKDINFIKNISEEDLQDQWEQFLEQKDKEEQIKKSGLTRRIVFRDIAAKQIFGEDIRTVIIEGNKTTITYEDGEVVVQVKPKLKFIKKKTRKLRKVK